MTVWTDRWWSEGSASLPGWGDWGTSSLPDIDHLTDGLFVLSSLHLKFSSASFCL